MRCQLLLLFSMTHTFTFAQVLLPACQNTELDSKYQRAEAMLSLQQDREQDKNAHEIGKFKITQGHI